MITNILLTKGYGKGYLLKDDSAMIQPIFPTANLAIRRTALDQIGLFDTVCKTSGEDVDLSIRMSKTEWEMFFEPRAIVRHKHRTTLRGLLKQWYGYGCYHPHIFKKHTPKCLEIHYRDDKGVLGWSSVRITKIFGLPFPLHVLIFITPFHLFHIFLFLALFSIIIKSPVLLTVALGGWLAVWLYFSGRQFFRNAFLKRDGRWLIYSMLRYVLNWVYVLGAFIAGLKIGILYLDVTREQTPSC